MQANTKVVVAVIGATGKQGGSVVNALLKDPTFAVRGITRDPASKSSKALQERGAQITQANLNDKKSLVEALRGADALFAVTNYWDPEQKKKGIYEVQQGKNIADAAEEAGIKHVVFSSLPNVEEISKGKIHAPDLTNKNTIEKHMRTKSFRKTFVYMAFYATTLLESVQQIGKDEFAIYLPLGTSVKIPVADIVDLGLAVHAILQDQQRFDGQIVQIVRDRVTVPEIIASLVKHTGKKVSYAHMDFGTFCTVAGVDVKEMFLWIEKHGYYGSVDGIQLKDLVEVPSFDAWVEQNGAQVLKTVPKVPKLIHTVLMGISWLRK